MTDLVASFITPWFADTASRRTGLRRTRIERTALRFLECLESEADQLGTTGERTMLAMERQFSEPGAASRVIPIDALPDVLRVFVSPAWLPDDAQDRRVQVHLVTELCDQLLRTRPGDERWSVCGLLDLRADLRRVVTKT